MMTTAEKRAAKLDRAQLLALRAALCPSSGRERLSLNSVQSDRRNRLQRGRVIAYAGDNATKYGKSMLGRIETQTVGKLRPDECRAVQPSAIEPQYGLLWADLTPPQRKALRKYRAGKKREREIALVMKQMKREGLIAEAQQQLAHCLSVPDAEGVKYWQKRIAALRG